MQSTPRFNSETLLRFLDEQGLNYECISHAPLMTVEDAKSIRKLSDTDQGQIKNLFVKNKKGAMWLLTLHEDRKINLKEAARAIGANRFSFCSEQRLMQYLGVTPGAVSPLGLLNDIDSAVCFYIDERLLKHTVIHVHPLDNRKTVTMATSDMLQLLQNQGHPYRVLESDVGN